MHGLEYRQFHRSRSQMRQPSGIELAGMLPGNRLAAEAALAEAAKTPAQREQERRDALREQYERAEEARKARAARTARWTGMRDGIVEAIRTAEGHRYSALEAGDVEAALAAQQRILGLRALIDPLREAANRDLGPVVDLAHAERV